MKNLVIELRDEFKRANDDFKAEIDAHLCEQCGKDMGFEWILGPVMEHATVEDIFGPVIDSYTRAEALEDGYLVDVSKMAAEAGFRVPVAVTRAVWDQYITPDERSRRWGQSEDGRLWDVLWMLFMAIKRGASGAAVHYRLYFIMKERQRRLITLKAVYGPGDNGEHVITVTLPDED